MSLRHFLVLFSTLFLASSANALMMEIDGGSCGSCEGSDLFMEIIDNGGTFDVTLRINTDDYTGPKDGMVQVGFGGISGWTSAIVDSAPASSAIAWADPAINSNINSSGMCNGPGTTDKVCTYGFVDVSGGGDYEWNFTVTGGTLKTDTAEWHWGGQYADLADLSRVDRRGNEVPTKGHIISEDGPGGPNVPEPGAAMLFGLGVMVAARAPRMRR